MDIPLLRLYKRYAVLLVLFYLHQAVLAGSGRRASVYRAGVGGGVFRRHLQGAYYKGKAV